jgi:ribosomal protein L13
VVSLSYKKVSANKENVKKELLVLDYEGQKLGRLSSKLAKHLISNNSKKQLYEFV